MDQGEEARINRRVGRILVVDDDEMLLLFLERILAADGHRVCSAKDGAAALRAAREQVSLVLLDLNLPDGDGLEILRHLRSEHATLPILVLTARSRTQGVLPALASGADDCLTKPFSYLELLARVQVLLARDQRTNAQLSSRCSDLSLHREQMLVTRGERRIELTQREFAVLEFLMRTPDTPVPRAVLLKEVWGSASDATANVVDVYLKYVRDKVDLPGLTPLIRTVRGTGYMVSSS